MCYEMLLLAQSHWHIKRYMYIHYNKYWLCCVLKRTVPLSQFSRKQSSSHEGLPRLSWCACQSILHLMMISTGNLSGGVCINFYEKFDFDHSYAFHRHLPSVDKPDVISSVFLAACSLMRNSCTRASIELSCSPWSSSSWLLSWLSWQGEVRSWTREAMFGLLSSTKLIKSSKL